MDVSAPIEENGEKADADGGDIIPIPFPFIPVPTDPIEPPVPVTDPING